jgi:hypothetical protein
MSILAEYGFDLPAMFQESTCSPSPKYTKLLWNGLSINTRKGYRSAVNSYEVLYTLNSNTAWLATEQTLGKWITACSFGSPTASLEKIKPDTIQSYLAALWSSVAFDKLDKDQLINHYNWSINDNYQ